MPSIEEKRHQLRVERWEKFRDHYVINVMQKKIDEALVPFSQRLGCGALTFAIEPDKWSVIAMVPVVYYWHGFLEEDKQETIHYVEMVGHVHLNGRPIGPEQKAKYAPKLGFYTLDQIVEAALAAGDTAPLPQSDDEHLVASIMADPTAPPTYAESAQLVDLMANELIQLGYGPRKSRQLAEAALSDNPEVSDIDQLVDMALNSDKD